LPGRFGAIVDAGAVVEVGSNVTKVKSGDRIAGEIHITCGSCYLCRTGNQHNCQNIRRFKNGVFAEYALIPEFCAEVVPDSIPYEIACLFEPFGVAVHAASLVPLLGESAAVFGAGPIGLFSILTAKAAGAGIIIATDISDYRVKLAIKAGAEYAFNPNQTKAAMQAK